VHGHEQRKADKQETARTAMPAFWLAVTSVTHPTSSRMSPSVGQPSRHAMHSPPSTTNAWPVMKDERSEARNRIASAISPTVAKRPIGILSFT